MVELKVLLSAPLTQVQDVAGSWSATMKGSIKKDYSAYKISTGSGSQDLALVFGEGVDDEKYVDFKVTWVQHASVKVIKKMQKQTQSCLVQCLVYTVMQTVQSWITKLRQPMRMGKHPYRSLRHRIPYI